MPQRTAFMFGVVFLAACGSGGASADGARSDSTATAKSGSADAAGMATTGSPDACALVTVGDLAAAFGARQFVVDNSGPAPRNIAGTATTNTVSSCTFVSAGATVRDMATVTVMLVTAPSDAKQNTVAQMKKGVMSLGIPVTPVDIPALGNAAYWVNLGSAQRSSLAVNVQSGSRHWLTVSESSVGQPVDTTVGRLIQVARTALTKL